MPGFIGLPEMLLLAVVVLVIFGPKRLPEMGRSMGKGLREFKDSISGDSKADDPLVDLRNFGHEQSTIAVATPVAPQALPVASTNGTGPRENVIVGTDTTIGA